MLHYDGIEIDLENYKIVPNFLRRIYRDLLADLGKQPTIKLVRDFRYDNNQLPDYSNNINQKLYLLKYYMAYFVEYLVMYTQWKQINFQNQNVYSTLKVISVGCGATCDYLSLYYVLKNPHNSAHVDYWGIDLVEWEYMSSDLEKYKIVRADISQWITEKWDVFSSADIIIFPKSIGEISTFSFMRMLQQISSQKNWLNKTRISILGSFAKAYHARDIDRYNQFVEVIRRTNNFHVYDRKESNLGVDDLSHETFTWFYPQEVDFSRLALENHCQLFRTKDVHCGNCSSIEKLTHHPITKTKYFDYAITVLEK